MLRIGSLIILFLVLFSSCKKKNSDVSPATEQPNLNPNPNAVQPSGEAYVKYVKENDKIICEGSYDDSMNLVTVKFFSGSGSLTSLITNIFTSNKIYKTITTNFTLTGSQSDVSTMEYEYSGPASGMTKVTDYQNGIKDGYSEITYDGSNRIVRNQGYSINNSTTAANPSYLNFEYENNLIKKILQVFPAKSETYTINEFTYDTYGNLLTEKIAEDSMHIVKDSVTTICYINNQFVLCKVPRTTLQYAGTPSKKLYLSQQFTYDYKVIAPNATIFKGLSGQVKNVFQFVHGPTTIIEYMSTGGIRGTTSIVYTAKNSSNFPTKLSIIGNGFSNNYEIAY